MPRHSSSPRRPASPRSGGPAIGPPQARGPGRLDPSGGGCPVSHAPYAIVRPEMQTSLARRQRHRRALGQQPRGRNGSRVLGAFGAVVIALFIGTFIVAGIGFAFVVGAYNSYSPRLN